MFFCGFGVELGLRKSPEKAEAGVPPCRGCIRSLPLRVGAAEVSSGGEKNKAAQMRIE